ncbi:MAG: Major Facilitator Superfamily transporter [Symbiobacteriaceae bacterium]|jgi:MFS family permease|nr:Major Facilitator Superfamily transporter [Symbiobacteriaceae bacterium]
MSGYQAPKHGFRTFTIIWATQSLSVIGTQLTLFAVNIYLAQVLFPLPEQKPQLAGAFTLLNLAHFIPTLITAPLAGAWADRHDRKRTMLVADLLSAAMSLVLVNLLLRGPVDLWTLIGFAAGYGILGAFHGSAFDTAYAMLVPDHQLPRANGMMQTMWSLSAIVAPGLAAFLISLPTLALRGAWGGPVGTFLASLGDGTALTIAVDSATFFLAAMVLPLLHVPSPRRADLAAGAGKPRRSIWADIREGAIYIWRRRPMLWLLATFTVVNMLSPFGILLPLMVKFNLAADWGLRGFTYETALAMLNTLNAVGAVVSGVTITLIGGLKTRRVYGVVVPLLVIGMLATALGLTTGIYVAAGLLLLAGALFPIANVHSQSIWQTQTPRELQGRVFSVRRVIAQCAGPLGLAVAGGLAGRFDAGYVLAAMGGVMGLMMLAQLFNPQLLKVEDKAYLDNMAAEKAAAAGETEAVV